MINGPSHVVFMWKKLFATVVGVQARQFVTMAFQPVVLSGPSGSGKSTLVKKLMDEYKDCFAFSVSHTTRKPRPGEEHGKDYYFVSTDEMKKAIENGEFIEHAEFSGNFYGTSHKAVDDVSKTGRICILDVDMQGVKSIKRTTLDPRYIFLQPPSMATLEERLRKRGTENEESIKKRLDAATAELEYASVERTYDHTVVNDELEEAYEKLKGILIQDIDHLVKQREKRKQVSL